MFLVKIQKIVEKIVFSSRWLLIPFYLGLIIALVFYAMFFCAEIASLFVGTSHIGKESVMLMVLELVDVTMVANLIKMIITGSYTSFVNKSHSESGEHVSSGQLKVKMASSLIGVSSIHLLQTFLNVQHVSWDELNKQLIIHSTFLIGALILAVIDWLHSLCETKETH